MTMTRERIAELRAENAAERLSYGELIEIQGAYEATNPDPDAEQAVAASDMLDEIESALPSSGHVQISGRRWFDRGPGNTYHSVTVTVDGEHIGTVPFAYGYGDQYVQTATEILERDPRFTGKLDGPVYLRYALRDLGFTFGSEVADVTRRRDLHNGGR